MTFLILSVLFSVSVSILLKVARKRSMSIEIAIGVNYIIATVLAWFFLKPDLSSLDRSPAGIVIALALGLLLPSVFVLMGRSVEGAGIIRSDAAQRLSLLLPIVTSIAFFGEQINAGIGLGIVVAFLALAFLLHKPEFSGRAVVQPGSAAALKISLLLGGVWLGYGTIDILFKQMSKLGNTFPATLMVTFILAGIIMWSFIGMRLLKQRRAVSAGGTAPGISGASDAVAGGMGAAGLGGATASPAEKPGIVFNRAGLVGGVVLGILNFGNILFYLKAHVAMHENPSIVFAGMNMGVISLGAIVGWAAFKEHLSKINVLGIVLAMIAIGLLVF